MSCLINIFPFANSAIFISGALSVNTVFLRYKMEIFSFQNNPKNLGPSYQMDLDI